MMIFPVAQALSQPDARIQPLNVFFGPSVNMPIYLEIDWMEDGSHTHKPKAGVVDEIVATFMAEGYDIHIDVSNAIPHQNVIDVVGSGPSASPQVQAIASTYFNHQGDSRYFYAIWGHNYSYSGTVSGSSGIADLPGRIHLVTLGSFPDNVGTFSQQAGTEIHEFGHNIGQKHGGADHSNYKPNYFSIMNYYYQLDGVGVTALARGFTNSTNGINNYGYSRGALPSLDQSNLNENPGIGMGTAIDWNCNGVSTDAGVAHFIQDPSWCYKTGTLAYISDFNNWADINGYIRTSAGAFFPPDKPAPEICIDWDEYQKYLSEMPDEHRARLLEFTSGQQPRPAANTGTDFYICNDGPGMLSVNSIAPDSSAPWIGWSPAAPFNVTPGANQKMSVSVNMGVAPAGASTRRLLISTNDPAANPYPGGVQVVANNTGGPGIFTNPAPITIVDADIASPYPSVINVAGLSGVVSKVTVTLNGITHTYPADIDMLLVGPGGQSAILMSDSGGGSGISSLVLSFDDAASGYLPCDGAITTGIYKPTNCTGTAADVFPPPAPMEPYGAALSEFNNTNPNGDWKLFIVDDSGEDSGYIAGGWTINIATVSGFAAGQDDRFTTGDPYSAGPEGWSFSSGYGGWRAYDPANHSLYASIGAEAGKFRGGTWQSNYSEWLPYASVGADKVVRGKFYIYAAGQTPFGQKNLIPNLRLRLQNRYAVNSMLEVFHTNNNSGADPTTQELAPTQDPARPSLYRVDIDPVDVPFLSSGGEGFQRVFDVYGDQPQFMGAICLCESVIGTYPRSLIAEGLVAPSKVYTYTDLAAYFTADEQKVNYIPGAAGSFPVVAPDPPAQLPTITEIVSVGVMLDCANVPAERVGAPSRNFNPPQDYNDIPSLVRAEENKQYVVRWHLTSTQYTNQQAQIRMRARSIGYGWSQKFETGGAYPTNGSATQLIAQQTLPGIGCMNPDKNPTGENGGWYTMIVHTPMCQDIRPDVPGSTIAAKMPLISALPGPGSPDFAAGRDRALRFGLDILDTISGGTNAYLEKGNVLIDRLELRVYNLVSDN
ncbi:MAG: hypothetical protein NTY46_05290 [Candidatus Sumerlaeota bacterium]|nr:hypothetical protein [Candidatus Sumerlaeota bacterium]